MTATAEYQRAQDLELYNGCFKNDFTLINNILSQPLQLFPNQNPNSNDKNNDKIISNKPLLIYANPNLRVSDGGGWTALLLACSKPTGAAKTVRMLLERSFACDIISSTSVVPNLEQHGCKIFEKLKFLEDILWVERRKRRKEDEEKVEEKGKIKSKYDDDENETLLKYQQEVENAECNIVQHLAECGLFQRMLPNIANSICHPSVPPSPRAPPNNVSNLHLAGQNGCADVIFEIMGFLASESTTTTHLHDDISEFLKYSPSSLDGHENENNNKEEKNVITSALLRWVRVFLNLHFFIFKARKYPINAQDVQGATAAFMAAQNNSADCVKLLIEGSNKQQQALSRLLSRYEKTREDFLSLVAKSFVKNKTLRGFDAFMHLLTVHMREAKEVSVYAKQYVPVLNLDLCLGSSGAGPLHIACERGHLATVRALLCLDNNNNNINSSKNDDLIRKNIDMNSQDYEYRRKGEELFGGYYNYGSNNNNFVNNNNNNNNFTPSSSSLRVQPANVHQKLSDASSCIFVACVAAIPLPPKNTENNNTGKWKNTNFSTDHFSLCIRTILEHEKQTNGIQSMKRLLDFQKPFDKTSAVFAAVNSESISCLSELIRYDANVDVQTADGVTPLFLVAATHGNPAIVRLLIGPKNKPSSSSSPVGVITPIGDSFAASCELGGQADPNLAKSDGATPIFVAAQQRNVAALKAIISSYKKADVNIGMKPSGFAPLHVACDKGYADVVEILLSAENVNCNVENEFGLTPIHLATQRDHVDVVRVMIEKTRNMKHPVDVCKAPRDPHAKSKNNNNNNNSDDVEPDGDDDGPSPIFFSAFRGKNVETLALLLSSPTADPNIRKKDGATPVFATIQENRPEFLQVLLDDPRTDPNLGMFSGNGGAPPIFVACVRENLKVLKLLVQDAVKNNNRTRIQQKVLVDSNNNKNKIQQQDVNNNDADCFILCIQHKKFAPLQLMLDEMPISFRRKVMIDMKNGNEGFLYASSAKSTLGIACCEHDNVEALKMILLLDESSENEKRKQKLAASEQEWRDFVIDFLSKQNALGMTTFFAAALHSTQCLKLFVDFIEKELRRCIRNNNNDDDKEKEKTYVARLQQLIITSTNDNSCPLFAATMAACRNREGAIDRIKLLLTNSSEHDDDDDDDDDEKNGSESSLRQNQNPSILLSSSDIIRKNINLAKSDGATSLFMAIQMHANEAAKLILKQGNADPASCLTNKSTCLMIAAEVNNLEMVQEILDSYESESAKEDDVKNQNSTKQRKLRSRQELQALIQQRNEPFGFNAILVAAANGRTEIAKLLIEKGGANANDAEPHDGTSAAFLCAQNGHAETLKLLLLKHGADPNLSKKNSNTSPLIVACHLLRKEIVHVLLSSLEDFSAADDAVSEKSKFRLNVQQCDSIGGSALHHSLAVVGQCRLILEKEFNEDKENEIVQEKKLVSQEQWNMKKKEVEDNLSKALEIVEMLKKYF